MKDQLILPFSQWTFPEADARLLAVANAFEQPRAHGYDERAWERNWKRWYFYPLKGAILRAHAVPDGFDVQVLKLPCNRCFKGVWSSECGYHSDLCWHCSGTGVYRRDAVRLSRWSLSGMVFHCPEERVIGISDEALDAMRAGASDTLAGLVKHPAVDEATARRAFLKLLRKYDAAAYDQLLDIRVAAVMCGIRDWAARPFRRAINAAWQWVNWSESNMAEGLREWFGIEEVPF